MAKKQAKSDPMCDREIKERGMMHKGEMPMKGKGKGMKGKGMM